MRALKLCICFAVSLCLLAAVSSFAQTVPGTFTYQGKLGTPDGKPLPDDRYGVTFNLFPTQTGGTAFWTQNREVVTTRGIFAVELGPLLPSDLMRPEVWLEVRLDGLDPFPRQRMNAVPYAMLADDLVLPFSGTVSYLNPAFTIDQTGTGSGGVFYVHNPNNSASALYAYTNGTGKALQVWASGNGTAGYFEKSNGTGSAGIFRATGYSNSGHAIEAYSNGTGAVIQATTDHTGAIAGYFKVDNTSSQKAAVFATTTGTGASIQGYTGGSATGILATSAGSGPALKATGSYGGSAVVASSSGTGVVVDVSTTNTNLPTSVMRVANAPGGQHDTLSVYHYGPVAAAVEGVAPNGAVAGAFEGGGPGSLPALEASTTRESAPALKAVSNALGDKVAAEFQGRTDTYGNSYVSGSMDVDGSIVSGPNSVGMPIGYAYFSANGTRVRGTSNLTCTALGDPYVGEYLVRINGQTFTDGSHIVLITPLTTSSAVVAHCWPFNGDIRVEFRYLSSGNLFRCAFSILIY